MNPVAAELLASGRIRTLAGDELPLHSHLPLEECLAVQGWIAIAAPHVTLEVGMGYGISSIFIAEALADRDAAYHIVDPHQRTTWRGAGIRSLERAGFGGRYLLHEEPSEVVLPRMFAAAGRLDFALLDGWHSFDQIMMEVYFVNRMMEVGGVIVLDDLHLGAVGKALAFLSTLECFERIGPCREVAASRKVRVRRMVGAPELRVAAFRKTAIDDRRWDWHRDF